eukprot:GHVS01039089.1.p1 GENE.GHVS01039089.1~~GHVS01039089.1.p1  ORF type:complete len:371 (+),score=114.98 GHVS01039089.1:875-1987(+)
MMAEVRDKVGVVGAGVSEDCREWFDQFLRQQVKWKDFMSEEVMNNDDANLFEIDASGRSQDASSESSRRGRYTHIKLNLLPDGGISRFQVFGEIDILEEPITAKLVLPSPPPPYALLLPSPSTTTNKKVVDVCLPLNSVQANSRREVDLAATANGGLCLCWSDDHYGNPNNLLMPVPKGWETARNPSRAAVIQPKGEWLFPDSTAEWVIVKLGGRGAVRRIVVETEGYGGSYPESVEVDGWDGGDGVALDVLCQMRYFQQSETTTASRRSGVAGGGGGGVEDRRSSSSGGGGVEVEGGSRWRVVTRGGACSGAVGGVEWRRLLMRTRVDEVDAVNEFECLQARTCTHIRLRIFPDGGLSRLRVWGMVDKL